MAGDVGREERRAGQHLQADLAAEEEQGRGTQPSIGAPVALEPEHGCQGDEESGVDPRETAIGLPVGSEQEQGKRDRRR
jgi:hypothetical protein